MKVYVELLSKMSPDATPVVMTWYDGDDPLAAVAAVANLVATSEDKYTKTVSIRMEF